MKKQKKSELIIIIILMTFLNIFLGSITFLPGSATNFDGELATSSEMKKSLFTTFIIVIPILGLLISSIINMILKLLNRPKNFLHLFLLSILGINILAFFVSVWRFVNL